MKTEIKLRVGQNNLLCNTHLFACNFGKFLLGVEIYNRTLRILSSIIMKSKAAEQMNH